MVSCSGASVSWATFLFSDLLVLQQHLARALNDRERQAGETSHLNAVALVGRAGLDGVQKDNALRRLFDGDAQVFQSWQLLGQQCELMVVGSEECPRAHLRVQIFERGPGQREAIEGGGTAAHLVQQDERLRCGGVENGGGLRHFHHKG